MISKTISSPLFVTYMALISLFVILPGCQFDSSETPKPEQTHRKTYFVQVAFDSPILREIRSSIVPLINHIIKEELDMPKESESKYFSPKERQPITLYYIVEVQRDSEEFLTSVFDSIQEKCLPLILKDISFTSSVHFFAGPFGIDDELVIKIDDPTKGLLNLNHQVKTIVNQANEQYRQIHAQDLYNISKSERFPYIPHIGLGRVRSNFIKESMKDPSQFNTVFARIQNKIIQAVSQTVLALLNQQNKNIQFNTLCLFDLSKRVCLKEVKL